MFFVTPKGCPNHGLKLKLGKNYHSNNSVWLAVITVMRHLIRHGENSRNLHHTRLDYNVLYYLTRKIENALMVRIREKKGMFRFVAVN